MSAVTDLSPQETYKRLLFLGSNEISGTPKVLADGAGNDSVLSLSTSGIGLSLAARAYFRETTNYINSSQTGYLDLVAPTEIDITSPLVLLAASTKVSISKNLEVLGTDSSSTYADGAMTVAGGVGIAKNLIVGTTLEVTGETTLSDITTEGGDILLAPDAFGLTSEGDINIDSSGDIKIGARSAEINIGDSTSETTIGDNATVKGNLTVDGDCGVSGTLEANITSAGASTFSNIDINGGSGIDGVPIGENSESSGKFTTLETTGLLTLGAVLNGNGHTISLDADGDTGITSSTDDVIDIEIGAENRLHFDIAKFYPENNNYYSFGTSALRFKDLFLAGDIDCLGSASVDDFTASGNVTIGGHVSAGGAISSDGYIANTGYESISGSVLDGKEATSHLTITARAITIGDGSEEGQIKRIIATVDSGGTATLGGANTAFASMAFTDAGQGVTLMWSETMSKWYCVGTDGTVVVTY